VRPMVISIRGTKAHLVPTGTRRCVSLGLLLYITLNAACFVAQPAQLAFLPGDNSRLVLICWPLHGSLFTRRSEDNFRPLQIAKA
jgi:hypothetical protein